MKHLKTSTLLALAALLFVCGSFRSLMAQSALEADAACFRYDSTHVQLELYYGVLERALAFAPVGAGDFSAVVSARAEVWQDHVAIVKEDIRDTIRVHGTREQVDALGANKLMGIAAASVPYGNNTTAAFIWQRGDNVTKADTIVIPMTLPDRTSSHLTLGGIELASAIEKSSGQQGSFDKAGYKISPNPSSIFGENYSKLYYYTELYVPQTLIGSAEPAEVVTRVLDPAGKEVLSSTQKVKLLGATMPVIAALDVDGLPDDSYKLDIMVKLEDALQAESVKPFFFTSGMKLSEEEHTAAPDVSEDALFAASDFGKLSETEADERLAQSLYTAGEVDRKAAKKLGSLAEKQHFLFNYWRRKDAAVPKSAPLAAYQEFMKRVAEANKMFVYQKTPGWKSARGRIHIIFGPPPPRGITNKEFVSESKPYITWEYDPTQSIRTTDGQKPLFVFLDRQGGGNYFLVHSNVVGETSEPDWYNREALRLSH